MAITKELIEKLATYYKDDKETLLDIEDAVQSFLTYYNCIYNMETKLLLLDASKNAEEYQTAFSELDSSRTAAHNSAIANVSLLNKLSEISGLPPIYEGVVSKDKQYRKLIADEILSFAEEIIKERI